MIRSKDLFCAVLVAAIALAGVAGPLSAQGPHGPSGSDMWDPPWMQRDMWGPGGMDSVMRHRMERHWTFMHRGLPREYADAHNPLSPTTETIDAGRDLYNAQCASCHGPTGMGDGEAGRALNPSPALLAYLIQMPMTVDSYLLWTISDGGTALGTDMPAFRDTLARNDIWRIVTFMRAGFPAKADRN